MLLFLLFLPLLSTIILLGKTNNIGTSGALLISCLNITYILIISCLSFFFFALNGQIYLIYLGNWINLYFFKLSWVFLFDNLTFIMLLVVTLISTFVHFYSISYMESDPHLSRFMAYLSLFTFFMLILITANNFLQLFLGWEGVGLCSYLLISFWYTRIQANKSALKALFVNRIGDIALLIAIIIIYFFTYSLDYAIVFLILLQKVNTYFIFFNIKFYTIKIICFFLFVGAIGKSAQIGLHMWLPDAMEGPTPVSALIHAATMVTAGVFLIIRCSILFDLSLDILLLIIFIGALTALLAATMGIFQHDIKKIIAYSTCSQLGYMIVACGLSNYIISLYHLTTHALFKALLFLSAGAIIHALLDEQDLRKMGGLKNLLPFTYSVLVIGSFALMGFPFLAGFYSKDLILELTFNNFRISGLAIEWLMRCATILTAIYSTRIFYRVFLDLPNGNRISYFNSQEVNYIMYLVLLFLGIGSLFSGYFLSEIFTGIGNSFFSFIIVSHSLNDYFFENEMFAWHYKNLPLILSFLGFFNALFIYYTLNFRLSLFQQKLKYYFIYLIGVKKWFIDILLNELLVRPFLLYSYKYFFLLLDRGYLEILGPTGLNYFISFISKKLIKEHNVDLIKYLRVNIFVIIVFFIFFI